MITGTRTLNPLSRANKTLKPEYKAAAGEILLYDEIGPWGVSAKQFIDDLAALDTDTVKIRINSPGGSVFDGMAIYTALKKDSRHVVAEIDGLAASAASFIALAADEVDMAENAFMMIHKAWGVVIGNADEFRDTADIMDKMDKQLASIYANKTGSSVESIMQMMSDETWFNAEEAKEYGLVDKIDGESDAKALFDLSAYNSVPAALKRKVEHDLRDSGMSRKAALSAVAGGREEEGFHISELSDSAPDVQSDSEWLDDLGQVLRRHR